MFSGEEVDHPILNQLNEKQREAVVCEDYRILVLAGAGSGKTKTLIEKVLYLIAEKNVDPRQILAITFTKNAANEMIDRLILSADKHNTYKDIISDKKISREEKNRKRREYIKKYPWLSNITIKTFHGLCNQILRRRGGQEFDTKYRILSDNRYDTEIESRQTTREYPEEIVNKIIVKLCEDADYLLNLKRYILDYYIDQHNIKLHKKGINLYEKPYTTLKGDRVASKAERDVADWLYRHRVKYTYEPTIAPGTFEMQPDFFIEEANIYLEVVSSKSYPLSDKEKVMHQAGNNYVKLQDFATHDTTQFNQIMDELIFSKIDKDYSNISPLDFAEEFRGYEKYRRFFVLDVLRMIDKIKVEDFNFEEIFQRSQQDKHARIRDFYILSKLIWGNYHQYCINHSYLDFNDLLIRTVSLLTNENNICQAYQKRFKFILVDEFQDVNTVQVKLLYLLLNTDNQLFCVGDDWQSIYGFRGSNVEYIVNFEKFFPNSKLIKLDINYRSNDTIVEASNNVISHNKFKIEKEIKSFNTSGKKIYLYCAERELEDGVDTVVKNIENLLKNGFQKEDILVLSRTRKTDAFDRYYEELRKKKIRVTTIHQSKGLEAKAVFIVGLTGGYLGFPNVRDTDRIFQIIKENNYELAFEEERRLFYVALTRAKDELFLISEVGNESEFIAEIPGDFLDRKNFLILDLKKYAPIICTQCKRQIQKKFIFCPYCGNKIELEIIKNEPESNLYELPENNNEMLEKDLKSFRLNLAKEKKLPAFCIFNDRTLSDIVNKHPENISELKKIYGIGNEKINQFGEEIIKIVIRHRQTIPEINQLDKTNKEIENKNESQTNQDTKNESIFKKISKITKNRELNLIKKKDLKEKEGNTKHDEAVVSIDKLLDYDKSIQERIKKKQKQNRGWGDGGVY